MVLKFFKEYLFKRYLPRWLVLLFDLHCVLLTFSLAYVLRFNFDITAAAHFLSFAQMAVVVFIFLLSFLFFKPYAGILRHSTSEDMARVILSLVVGSIGLAMITLLVRLRYPDSFLLIPYSVIVIELALISNILIASRVLAKAIFSEWFVNRKDVKQVMIYGAGKMGHVARHAMMVNSTEKFNIIGFIDNDDALQHKSTAGVPIYSLEYAFEKIIPRNNVAEIIIALDNQESLPKLKREMVDLCLPLKIVIKEVPSVNNWINGELNAGEIKQINIEDLLGREPIKLNHVKIKEGVKNAAILVAGAAGSIGSEIVKQLISFNAYKVILLDKAESDLYDLQNEILAKFEHPKFTVIVGDVTNRQKMQKIFEDYSPSMVLNAAAYKHVPLMEEFPGEAIRVNIGGTKILADLSVKYGVEKFVLISTDKAVNPTNVMGASKRIAEIYIQSLAQKRWGKTQFITTRFGNVLGSNGSVVPLFKKQIANGGPVTVTHREITRFFMTIPEACQLVLDACFMGKGGEIFVFDMGESVKIYNLAERMIYLSGYVPHKDIKIKITRLRPGEKLYEEVLQNQEDLLPTHNKKILIGKVIEHDYRSVNSQIKFLLTKLDEMENYKMVELMKLIVPEYVSMNSPYMDSNNKIISIAHTKPTPKVKQVVNMGT